MVRDLRDEADERPNYYDVVCHFQVLEHVPDPLKFMQACADVLRPGGLLIVAVPSRDSFLSLVENNWLNLPPHHLTLWSDRALESILSNVAISSVEVWHEPVVKNHQDWHRLTMTKAGLMALYGSRSTPVSTKKGVFAEDALSRIPESLHRALFAFGMRKYPKAFHGHTVCITGRKAS